MLKYSIKDDMFSHAFSSSGWHNPTFFEWDRVTQHGDILFFTDTSVVCAPQIPSLKKYAWLIESPVVTPHAYQFVKDNPTIFDKIFTHSNEILELPNSHLVPIGGCLIDDIDISVNHGKTKLISMMYSFKRFAPGHELRYQIVNRYSDFIDIMGSGKTGVTVKKINSCKDYAFSIAIENCKKDYYFTEKIIDCFLTGTVPIYWGCPSIGKFFNLDGFFTFDTIDDLHKIIGDQNMLMDFYGEKSDILLENYERALKYKIAEDYLYLNYIKN